MKQAVFRYEMDLVAELDSQVRDKRLDWEASASGTIRELATGRVIPDLIAWWHEETWDGMFPGPLTTLECVLLSQLRRKGPTRVDILEAICGAERGAFRNGALHRLEQNRILVRGRGGRVALSQDWPPPTKIIAFEAKLTKWRQALEQAKAYRRFADETYVVLPQALERTACEHSDCFSHEGIGLLVVGSGKLSRICDAQLIPHSSHDWRREHVLSRILYTSRIRKVSNVYR